MSTFNGIVDEFPDIRIDFFRSHAGRRPPSACFLSHIHSDHLQGLESLKMPFVYCSVATKKILLRMEKYPHRINFQKGILEARTQTYKHLKKILRELPLHTPIELELGPKTTIRVTLFDANHCPGAVMFLIEGEGKSILYTGDIRAELWWVNSIVRDPILLPYSCGQKRLDCIYLDTTFASRDDVYKEFPTKAKGLKELLTKVEKCPKDSLFYFRAWTLGYEDVWIALSNALSARVHVDEYQRRLFEPLVEGSVPQAAALTGCQVGNRTQPGCLTTDTQVQIHSCEPGMDCHAELSKKPNIVWVTPIISRTNDGTEIAELGAGGGGGDLYQISDLELFDAAGLQALETFCESMVDDRNIVRRLRKLFTQSRTKHSFKISLEGLGLDQAQETTLADFVSLISNGNRPSAGNLTGQSRAINPEVRKQQRVIHFPYSRHSSFSELRRLVSCFRPKDICPCTVDRASWSEDVSIETLFGDLCSEHIFRFDQATRDLMSSTLQTVEDIDHSRKRKRADRDDQSINSQVIVKEALHQYTPAVLGDARPQFNVRSCANTSPEFVRQPLSDDSLSSPTFQIGHDSHNSIRGVTVSATAFGLQNMALEQFSNESKTSPDGGSAHIDRLEAYKATKQYLMSYNAGQSIEIRIRSAGWKGHTEEEPLL